MKKYILLILAALILQGCPGADETVFPEYILAGERSGIGIRHHVLVPPDSLYHTHPGTSITRRIDLTGNGEDDFEIRFIVGTSPGGNFRNHLIKPLQTGNAVATDYENVLWALPLNLNDTIGSGLNWQQQQSVLTFEQFVMGESASAGLWFDKSNAFVGVKLEQGNKTRYGWIAIGTTSLWWDMVIREYAVR